jgi:hypothetical protein
MILARNQGESYGMPCLYFGGRAMGYTGAACHPAAIKTLSGSDSA